nr:serpin I2 isoform X1 [Zootoca vivipara]
MHRPSANRWMVNIMLPFSSSRTYQAFCSTMRRALLPSLLLTVTGIHLTRSHTSQPVGESTARLAGDLTRVLSVSQENENILCSPLGVLLALGTIHLGAKGKARDEIRQLLNLQGNDGEAFAPLQTLFSVPSEGKAFTFNLANALYLQEGFMVKEQYLHSNKEFFQTAVKLVNFQDAKASTEAISTWVENKTDGHLSDHNVSYQVLELPYKGEEFSFVLILPAEDVPVEKVEKLITAQLMRSWFAEMEEDEDVDISLPRFKIEQMVDLKEIIQLLNVTEIFNNGCDLSGITDSADVHVSKAIQKVCFEVHEDGSEAASSAGMHLTAIMSLSHKQVVANRPFLFILRHNSTGPTRLTTLSIESTTPGNPVIEVTGRSIVFMGKLANPDMQPQKRRDRDSL